MHMWDGPYHRDATGTPSGPVTGRANLELRKAWLGSGELLRPESGFMGELGASTSLRTKHFSAIFLLLNEAERRLVKELGASS